MVASGSKWWQVVTSGSKCKLVRSTSRRVCKAKWKSRCQAKEPIAEPPQCRCTAHRVLRYHGPYALQAK